MRLSKRFRKILVTGFAIIWCLSTVPGVQAWHLRYESDKLLPGDASPSSYVKFGSSVSVSYSTAIIGAPFDYADDRGSAYIFQGDNLFTGGPAWEDGRTYSQVGTKLLGPTPLYGETTLFGQSVGISNDLAIVGSPGRIYDRGAAFIFERGTLPSDSWGNRQELPIPAVVSGEDDKFGSSVAISGNTAIVGTPMYNGRQGIAHVFQDTGTGWTQVAELTASDAAATNFFGTSVAIAGDTAIVGAFGNDNFAGAAYVFAFDPGSGLWPEMAKLTASDREPGDMFGTSVAISGYTAPGQNVPIHGDTALVGAYGDDNGKGAAYVFKDAAGWTQQQKLIASDGDTGDSFGYSVGLSVDSGSTLGPTAIIGAPDDNHGGLIASGSAYAFVYSDYTSSWNQNLKLLARDRVDSHQFGRAVAMHDGHAIIGAPNDDELETDTGAAYFYLIPEPSTMVLLAFGGLCLVGFGWRRRKWSA